MGAHEGRPYGGTRPWEGAGRVSWRIAGVGGKGVVGATRFFDSASGNGEW